MKTKTQLRELREQRNMTQADLGKAIGCSGTTISLYERGVIDRMDHRLIRKLESFFELPSGTLFP